MRPAIHTARSARSAASVNVVRSGGGSPVEPIIAPARTAPTAGRPKAHASATSGSSGAARLALVARGTSPVPLRHPDAQAARADRGTLGPPARPRVARLVSQFSGAAMIAIAAIERHFHARLYEELGLPAGSDLTAVFRTRTASVWVQWAAESDLPLTVVRVL